MSWYLLPAVFLILRSDMLLAVWRPPLPYSIRLSKQPHTPIPVSVVLPLIPRPPLDGHLDSAETFSPLEYVTVQRNVHQSISKPAASAPEWLDEEQQRQYHYFQLPSAQSHYEDVKPVTEHIEDDLKYDFRTKIHHFR